MATLRVTNLNKVKLAIRKKIIQAGRDKDLRDEIGETAVQDIRKTNYGQASPVTQVFRRYFEKSNKTHPTYERRKINITFTGELLEDLKNNVRASTTRGTLRYIVEHTKKKHKLYRLPKSSGKRKRKKRTRVSYQFISNEIINTHGYDYLTFSDRMQKNVLEVIRKKLFQKLK